MWFPRQLSSWTTALKRRRPFTLFLYLPLLMFISLIMWKSRHPDVYEELNPHTIHLCLCIINQSAVQGAVVLLKSMLYFDGGVRSFHGDCQTPAASSPCFALTQRPRSSIHLHILTDEPTKSLVESALNATTFQRLEVSIYLLEPHLDKVNWIKTFHYAGLPGLTKILVPEILPQTLKKVILTDTDTLFNEDIRNLWAHFEQFSSSQFYGAAWEQNSANYAHWSETTNLTQMKDSQECMNLTGCPGNQFKGHPRGGINSGVVLWDLTKARRSNWIRLWRAAVKEMVAKQPVLYNCDQGIANQVLRANPHFLYRLPCVWNVQLFHPISSKYCPVVWPDRQAETENCRRSEMNGAQKTPPALVHYNNKRKPSASDSVPARNPTLSQMIDYLSKTEKEQRFLESFHWFRNLPEICFK